MIIMYRGHVDPPRYPRDYTAAYGQGATPEISNSYAACGSHCYPSRRSHAGHEAAHPARPRPAPAYPEVQRDLMPPPPGPGFEPPSEVRATVEAAAERTREYFVGAVCDELCPRFRELEIRASRVDAMQDALRALPEHQDLLRKAAALEKKTRSMRAQLESVVGPPSSERRVAPDGKSYTREQFAAYYGKLYWDRAGSETAYFGDADHPMSLRVKEKRRVRQKAKWTSLASGEQLQEYEPAANTRVDTPESPRYVRAPALFDGRGPSESDTDDPGDTLGAESEASWGRDACSSDGEGTHGDDADSIASGSEGSEGSERANEENVSEPEDAVDIEDEYQVEGEGNESDSEPREEEAEVDGEDDGAEEEEEVEEVTIRGKAYYASGVIADRHSSTGYTRDSNGPIYAIEADDDVGDQVGEFVNGAPRFYSGKASLEQAIVSN